MDVEKGRSPGLWIAAGFLVLAASLACANSLAKVREATYPHNYHYITQSEILETMSRLAFEVDALEQIMWQSGGPRPEDQAQVLEILERMQLLANRLKAKPQSNHPRIHTHAPRLQDDIARAIGFTKREPPMYFFAGRVAGACGYCHSPNRRFLTPAP